jgi:hypothetical protein
LLVDDSAGNITREICWTNQEFSPVDIISKLFSMLMYHLGDEQQARWWPQFRDRVSATDMMMMMTIIIIIKCLLIHNLHLA